MLVSGDDDSCLTDSPHEPKNKKIVGRARRCTCTHTGHATTTSENMEPLSVSRSEHSGSTLLGNWHYDADEWTGLGVV